MKWLTNLGVCNQLVHRKLQVTISLYVSQISQNDLPEINDAGHFVPLNQKIPSTLPVYTPFETTVLFLHCSLNVCLDSDPSAAEVMYTATTRHRYSKILFLKVLNGYDVVSTLLSAGLDCHLNHRLPPRINTMS